MIDPYKIKYYETEVKTYWQKHKNEIFLIGGISLLVICLSIYYVKCGHDAPVKGIVTPDVVIKKEVQKVVDSKKVDSLEKELEQAKKQSINSDTKARKSELRAKEFARMLTAIITKKEIDTTNTDTRQDDYTKQYIEANNEKDSLHKEEIADIKYESSLKDSTIKVLKSDKRILISSFNDLGYNSTMKDKAIKDLNRSLRWQKVKQYALLGALGYVAFKTLTK